VLHYVKTQVRIVGAGPRVVAD